MFREPGRNFTANQRQSTYFQRAISWAIFSLLVLQNIFFSTPAGIIRAASKTAAIIAPSVVVNKYQNSGTTADIFELLVIQNNLDMRGMIVKDFSSNMDNDGGGKFQFSTSALWSSLPAGTLIVLRNTNSAADTSVGGGDYNLDVGLQNTTYFTNLGGSFDIAATEMIMIKAAGSGAAGVTSSIHALAGGTAGAQFTAAPNPKLRASGTSGTNQFVYANNSTQSVADFDGTDATGAATGLIFGSGNNANNTAFINSLRSATPTPTNPSGSGAATPNTVLAGGTTLLTVTVTPGTNPTSTGIVVTGNLTSIGGSATQSFFDNGTNGDVTSGDNIFSYSATVGGATSAGNKTLPVTIIDTQSRSAAASIALTVTSNSTPLAATGSANPNSLAAGGSTLLTVTVMPGTNPASTGITIVGNLSSIGGASSQTFYDDATNGDVTAGDNVFSFNATVTAGTVPGGKTLSITIADAQSRTAATSISLTVTAPAVATLPFAQNWSNTNLITANDNWSGVTGVVGYRGDDASSTTTGIDPQTITADISAPVNVIANQTDVSLLSGGIAEFEIADPTVALQGSGTADAPHLVISLNTAGANNVTVSYNLRDIDGTADNAVQPVALQYRIGGSGNFTNIPSAFVSDATTGPSQATLVTPVAVRLPAAADNQPLVQLRIITTNANGNDEWVGIDDISVVSNGTIPLSGKGSGAPSIVGAGGSTLLTVAVNPATNPDSTNIQVVGNLTSIGGAATQTFYDDGTHGDAAAGDNTFSFSAAIPSGDTGGSRNIPVSISDAQGNTASTSIALTTVSAADPQEHLVMGNPSNATTDVGNPFNYLLPKPQYVMSYHRDRAIPNWVSWHLDASWIGSADRQDDFRNDTSLPAGWYQVQGTDYSGSGFDRGHHTPSADRTRSVPDNSATFLMTNMMPQAPGNNQGPWEKLESFGRTLVGQGNELYIVGGSVGQGGTGRTQNGPLVYAETIAGGKITVPAYTWKVILVLPVGNNDVSRVDANTRTIAVIMPNHDDIRPDEWQKYLATVDQVEALTGYDFFSNVPVNIQNVIESRLDAASNTSPQTVAPGTYANLDITAPNTTLTGNITVTGNLNLGGSVLNSTSNYCVTLGSGATVTRASGYVNGCVSRPFTPTLTSARSSSDNNVVAAEIIEYPVGTANGYSPVTVTVNYAAQSSGLSVRAVEGNQPNVSDQSLALKRYWRLDKTGEVSANLTFKYLDADVPATAREDSFTLQRYETGAFSTVPANLNTAANTATTAENVTQFSDWTLIAAVQPTAAAVSVSGRVMLPNGGGLTGALVTLTDFYGNSQTVRSGKSGNFRFTEVAAGESYILSVRSKRYVFAPQIVSVTEDVAGINFAPLE